MPSTRIKTKTDLARHFARFFKLNLINPIVGYVDGDAQQPTNDILYVFQGGLGLPDRDYYLKNDDKLKEYREKYVGFVGNILGRPATPAAREVGARDLRARNAAGARALDQRREPRRGEDLQQGRASPISPSSSPASTGRRGPTELGVNGVPAVVVNQPSYLKALAATVNELPVDAWKPYLQGVAAERLRAVSQQADRRRRVRLLQHDAARREGTAAAVEARRQHHERQPRRDARQAVCRAALQARGQGAHGGARRQPARSVSRPASTSSSGWGPRRRSRRRRSSRSSRRRSAIRTSGATTRSSRSRRTISSAT